MTFRNIKFGTFFVLTVLLTACVSKTTSSLTAKADPELAVQRYVQLGLEYIKRKDFHRARKHLNRALEINQDDSSANAALGLIYHEEDESELAETLFLKALEQDSEYTLGRSYYGAFLFSEERYQEAIEQFKLATSDKMYQGRSQIFANIALCHLKLGQTQKAIESYTKTLRLDRGNGRALSGITELLVQANNFERAQHYYNRLVNLIKEKGMQHSAQSLWMGIRIADHFGSEVQKNGLAAILNDKYPESEESNMYQRTYSNDVDEAGM